MVSLLITIYNRVYIKHCNGIFVNNYLLTGDKVPLYSIEMNSSEARKITIPEFMKEGEIKELSPGQYLTLFIFCHIFYS